jgi:hypothetical protein
MEQRSLLQQGGDAPLFLSTLICVPFSSTQEVLPNGQSAFLDTGHCSVPGAASSDTSCILQPVVFSARSVVPSLSLNAVPVVRFRSAFQAAPLTRGGIPLLKESEQDR